MTLTPALPAAEARWKAASARDKYRRRMYELFDENQELRIFFATMTQREPKFFEKKLAFDY